MYLVHFVQSGYWTIEKFPQIAVIYIPTSGYFLQENCFALHRYHGYENQQAHIRKLHKQLYMTFLVLWDHGLYDILT